MPRWVKVTGILVAIVVLALVVIAFVTGGDHGPGRHGNGAAGSLDRTPVVEAIGEGYGHVL